MKNPKWLEKFLAAYEERPELIVKLVKLYEQRAPELFVLMEKAEAEKDGVLLTKSTHSLIGCAGVFGCLELVDLLRSIEEEAAAKKDWDAVSPMLQRVDEEIRNGISLLNVAIQSLNHLEPI